MDFAQAIIGAVIATLAVPSVKRYEWNETDGARTTSMKGYYTAILAALICFGIFTAFWHGSEEVTVHAMYCPGEHPDGRCEKGGETANPTTYRAYVDQQTVIKWTWNSGTVTRFTFCAVRDGRNWTCKFEKAEEAPTVEYTMSDGKLSTTDFRSAKDRPLAGAMPEPFYEVTRWYWWFVWTSEHLGRSRL